MEVDVEALREAIERDADYSEAFTRRVGDLATRLSEVLGARVYHDTDMNYRAGQVIRIHVNPDGSASSDESNAAFRIDVGVSSRGPLWTVLNVFRAGDRPRHWKSATLSETPAGEVMGMIREVMREAGLQEVDQAMLDDPIPGKVTELDGFPATVKTFLFFEI